MAKGTKADGTGKGAPKAKSAKPAPKPAQGAEMAGESPKAATPRAAPAGAPGGPQAGPQAGPQEAAAAYQMNDPAEFSRNLVKIATQSQQLITDFLKRQGAQGDGAAAADPLNIGQAFIELTTKMMTDPAKLVEAQMHLWRDYMSLWQNTALKMLGQDVTPVVETPKGDKRFKDKDWNENQVFDFIKQSYLLTARWMQNTVKEVEGLDDQTARKVDFYTRQFVDAMSPSNFVLTNPEVLRETMKSNGENLVRGLDNLLKDIERGKGQIAIRMTDMDAFEVGRNIAVSPGKVVFRNDVIELLQYAPRAEQVYKTPLVIFPPWINKFYILDLRQENSFIKWASEQGFTVFVVSWANPDAKRAKKTFEDYMREGIFAALDAIEQATGERQVSAIGYCVGGTLLSATLAYMAEKGDDRIKAATFFAAQADFSEAGELSVFIDEEQLAAMEQMMDRKGGVLDAHSMFTTFNMLRSNDLIWSFVVNNYLMGKDPFPFDLLFWNSDQTNLPKEMHLFYLRECYQKNHLSQGKMVLGGVKLDLKKVKIPVYLQSSKEDHIAPMRSVFKSVHLFGGPVRYMVAGSGHIAGVINHPDAKKYQHWLNEVEEKPASLDAWWKNATEHPGSWWPDWLKWLGAKSGPKVAARVPGDGKLKPLCDAPGTYVKIRAL